MLTGKFIVETDREDDGRWIADAVALVVHTLRMGHGTAILDLAVE